MYSQDFWFMGGLMLAEVYAKIVQSEKKISLQRAVSLIQKIRSSVSYGNPFILLRQI